MIFTDEWGGGTRPRCRATDLPNWGADAIFDIVDKKLVFGGYYKMPAAQTEHGELRRAQRLADSGARPRHHGAGLVSGRRVGVRLHRLRRTRSRSRYFDRGPLDAKNLIIGGYWSTYWYNGNIYGSEIARGIDIFKLVPTQYLSQNEIDAAILVRVDRVQRAEPAEGHLAGRRSIVAKAYLDQLTAPSASRRSARKAVDDRLAKVDELRTGKERNAAASARRARRARRAGRGGCESEDRPRRDAPHGARRHD